MNRETLRTDPTAVADRELELAFAELAGRATPPDHLAAILRRTRSPRQQPRTSAQPQRWLLASAALVGIGVTGAIGWLARQDMRQDRREDATTAAFAQEPQKQQEPQKRQTPQTQQPPAKDAPKDAPKEDPAKKPSPKKHTGSDAADLRAQRGAEAMLTAEKRLAQMLKEGKIAGIDSILPFETLSGWRYEKGLAGCPEAVKALDGKKVLMTGFMLPIDEVRDIHHFLLVKSLWSCCYGTPPDINGIVRCVMPKGKTSDYQFEPLKIIGTLRVRETIEDGYCVDVYQLDIDVLEVIE